MARYQSKYGLKPIGPHRKMSAELLGSLNEKCKVCDGRGLRDTAHGSSWQVCKPCRGFGSFFTRPAYEIQALRRRVLATYPDAAAEPVPNFFTGTPALSLADQKMVDLSSESAQRADPVAPPTGQLPDSAWQQDVLALLPPTEDIAHLDRVWRLTADSSPLEKLTLWHPTDPGDLDLRGFLLDFGHRVRGAESPHHTTLKELTIKDGVTGLYNRQFFSIRLDEEVSHFRRSNHPVSVVLLHLDGVGRISDELGRVAGDETLRRRDGGHVVGRGAALRGAHPVRPVVCDVRRRASRHRSLRHCQPSPGRGEDRPGPLSACRSATTGRGFAALRRGRRRLRSYRLSSDIDKQNYRVTSGLSYALALFVPACYGFAPGRTSP